MQPPVGSLDPLDFPAAKEKVSCKVDRAATLHTLLSGHKTHVHLLVQSLLPTHPRPHPSNTYSIHPVVSHSAFLAACLSVHHSIYHSLSQRKSSSHAVSQKVSQKNPKDNGCPRGYASMDVHVYTSMPACLHTHTSALTHALTHGRGRVQAA